MTEKLIEVMDFKPVLFESGDGKGPSKFEGIGQRYDIKNANGRVYPRSLWEKLKSNQAILERFQSRKSVGQLGHPSGTPDPERISHVVTDFWLGENGDVLVKGEITETPSGKILEGLMKSGITLGISSRGSGSVKRINDADVVQEDFNLETWDWVLNPSTINAYPKLKEELENLEATFKKEISMDSREKLQLLENKAASVLSLKPSEASGEMRSLAEDVATEVIINLSKLGSDAPEVKSLTESLIDDLTAKRKELRTKVVEGMPPWLKDKDKKGEDDEDKDDKKDEKKEKKAEKKEESTVDEETSGSADQGFHRSVPKEAEPPKGEGWPINPGDAGVLNGINAGVDEFMAKAQPIPEEEEMEEEEDVTEEEQTEAKDDEEKDEDDEDVEESVSRSEQLVEIALKLISVEETKQNSYARAFAAAFLMENNKRVTESQAYARIVGKLQEKLQEAAETGTITLSEVDTTELEEKLEAAYSTIEQLESRHRLLSAKVYAENELRKIGQHENAEARKVVAEAIRKAATKTSIDEAILGLASIKGLKVTKPVDRVVNEEKAPEDTKTLEGTVAKLAEEKTSPNDKFEGAALGKRLSESLSFSRSTR